MISVTATVTYTGTMTNLTLWNLTNFESALLNVPLYSLSVYALGAQPPTNGSFSFTYTTVGRIRLVESTQSR